MKGLIKYRTGWVWKRKKDSFWNFRTGIKRTHQKLWGGGRRLGQRGYYKQVTISGIPLIHGMQESNGAEQSRPAVGDAWHSSQRSGHWWSGAGQGPLTPETDDRPAHARGRSPSKMLKEQPHWATKSVSRTQCNLAAVNICSGFPGETKTGILSWDTKRWLKQYWNIKIAYSKWKIRQCNKGIIQEKKK